MFLDLYIKSQEEREFNENKLELEMQMEIERQKSLEEFQNKLYEKKDELDQNLLPITKRPDRILKLTPALREKAQNFESQQKITDAELKIQKIDADVEAFLQQQKMRNKANQDI